MLLEHQSNETVVQVRLQRRRVFWRQARPERGVVHGAGRRAARSRRRDLLGPLGGRRHAARAVRARAVRLTTRLIERIEK